MNLIQVPSYSISLETIVALVPKTEGILFVGAGYDDKPSELITQGYRVICNDIDSKPKGYKGKWLQKDVFDLDYNNLKKEYNALISCCLCDDSTQNLTYKCVSSHKWEVFDYIAIEFCHNNGCYNRGIFEKFSVANNSKNIFEKSGFNTMVFNGGQGDRLDLMLIASKNTLPSVYDLFPKKLSKKNELEKELINLFNQIFK